MSTEDIFSKYFHENSWRSSESFSGDGSTLEVTRKLANELPILIGKYEITTILDIPCGDFNWMKYVLSQSSIDRYIGGDIVERLTDCNSKKYEDKNISFQHLDIINDKLPKVNLVIVRDCFIHLSLQQISKSLANIKRSGSKYILLTQSPGCKENIDISPGHGALRNFFIPPFGFPPPLDMIYEGTFWSMGYTGYSIKCMYLWKISDIKVD